MSVLYLFQPFPERGELGIAEVLPESSDKFDLDLFTLPGWVSGGEDFFEYLCVHDQSIDIISQRLHMDVLVDQLDSFGAQGVPEQFTVAAWRLHGFVHLGQPAIILFIRTEQRVGRQRSEERRVGKECR